MLANEGIVGLVLLIMWISTSVLLGIRTSMRLAPGSTARLTTAGLTAAIVAFAAAAVGHDMTSNYAAFGSVMLMSGVLVSWCVIAARSADQGERAGD
jgi:hypothetical protein